MNPRPRKPRAPGTPVGNGRLTPATIDELSGEREPLPGIPVLRTTCSYAVAAPVCVVPRRRAPCRERRGVESAAVSRAPQCRDTGP